MLQRLISVVFLLCCVMFTCCCMPPRNALEGRKLAFRLIETFITNDYEGFYKLLHPDCVEYFENLSIPGYIQSWFDDVVQNHGIHFKKISKKQIEVTVSDDRVISQKALDRIRQEYRLADVRKINLFYEAERGRRIGLHLLYAHDQDGNAKLIFIPYTEKELRGIGSTPEHGGL